MKIAIIVPVLLGSWMYTNAQTAPVKTLKPLFAEMPVIKTPLLQPGLSFQNKALQLTAVADGKIYALPQDNMPCLVAGKAMAALLPNATPAVLPPGTKIPNALPVLPVIPSKLSLGPVPMPKRPLLSHNMYLIRKRLLLPAMYR